MSQTLYVGGLSYSTTEEGLKAYFESAGQVVSTSIIMDRATSRSRGFGFVEMASPEEAEAAINQLHGTELDGRTITVNIARPKSENGGGGRRGGAGGGWNKFGGGQSRGFRSF
jgi:RNA recognition motif-containing protein